ncbi:MAG: prepilin-type N-terminal cleavage/methylation domain-containing protein [Gemmatales bacterium]
MKARNRSGFTIVELLVVIGIILIILAMILPLIMRIMQAVEETQVSREVKLLDQACEQFKATFGRYPPGRIMICEDMRGYQKAIEQHLCQDRPVADPTHQKALAYLAMMSMEYLQSIFPGIDLNAGHDWNGDGVIDDRQYYLNGNEAMVFLLGGMRYGKGAVDTLGTNRSGGQGFSTDKTQPTKTTTGTRLGPFFEFDQTRILYEVTTGVPAGQSIASPAGGPVVEDWTVGVSSGFVRRPGELFMGFYARYTDVWKTPYAYFSARNAQTDNYCYHNCSYLYRMGFPTGFLFNYHLWFSDITWFPTPTTWPSLWIPGRTIGSRSNPLDGTISAKDDWYNFVPYIESYRADQVRYYNANRFQIISAGRDKQFGTGGYLQPDPKMAETSVFENYKYFPEENIPKVAEKQANYDNITNINFGRVVPR